MSCPGILPRCFTIKMEAKMEDSKSSLNQLIILFLCFTSSCNNFPMEWAMHVTHPMLSLPPSTKCGHRSAFFFLHVPWLCFGLVDGGSHCQRWNHCRPPPPAICPLVPHIVCLTDMPLPRWGRGFRSRFHSFETVGTLPSDTCQRSWKDVLTGTQSTNRSKLARAY